MKYISNLKVEEIKNFLRSNGFNFEDEDFDFDIENSAVEIPNVEIPQALQDKYCSLLINESVINLFPFSLNYSFNHEVKTKILLYDYSATYLSNNFDLDADREITSCLHEKWINYLFSKFGNQYRDDYIDYWENLKKEMNEEKDELSNEDELIK